MTIQNVSGFVLGTTLLNQGPAALGELVATQPALLDDGEEARGLLMAVGSIASRLTLGDLREMRVGRYGNQDFHGKVDSLLLMSEIVPRRKDPFKRFWRSFQNCPRTDSLSS